MALKNLRKKNKILRKVFVVAAQSARLVTVVKIINIKIAAQFSACLTKEEKKKNWNLRLKLKRKWNLCTKFDFKQCLKWWTWACFFHIQFISKFIDTLVFFKKNKKLVIFFKKKWFFFYISNNDKRVSLPSWNWSSLWAIR